MRTKKTKNKMCGNNKSNFISIFLNQYFIIIDFDAKLDFTNHAIKIKKIDIFKDNLGSFVLIIPPSITGSDGPPDSFSSVISETFSNNNSSGIISETFSNNNNTNKK
jgi:hypothetical protein